MLKLKVSGKGGMGGQVGYIAGNTGGNGKFQQSCKTVEGNNGLGVL